MVVPKPVRPGGPEIWVGAQKWSAIERGARLGDGWIVGWQEDLPALKERVPRYREAAARNGRPATVCLMRELGIRATRAEVEEDWLPGAVEGFRHYARAGSRYRGTSPLYDALDRGGSLTLDALGAGQFVAGNPDDCIRDIHLFGEATGCEWFQCSFSSGAVASAEDRDYEELIASIKLFGREVIPAFR
jgi:alkanesulfonate monooxygenase SsuD/methylene tetrahydromethanopterin reductase-like flavin-dependent oxidoreductase (luciferase family)